MSDNDPGSLFSKYKKASAPAVPPAYTPPAPPPAAPAAPQRAAAPQSEPADAEKFSLLEAEVKDLRKELAALKGAAAPPPAPPKGAAKPDPALEEIKRELASAAEARAAAAVAAADLAVRLEASEHAAAELKVLLAAQQAQLTKLGEKGYAAAGIDEYLRETVSKLNVRLAEAESSMQAAIADISGRLTAGDAVYRKMFSDAETLLRKTVGGEIRGLESGQNKLRETLVWLADEYKVVMERKIRALEAKYSAFEAISRRMDSIDAALRMGAKKGSE